MSSKNPKAKVERRVERAKEECESDLLAITNVVGVGIGYKTVRNVSTRKLCIKVYVEKKIPESKLLKGQVIPKKIGSVEIDVEEAGGIKAL